MRETQPSKWPPPNHFPFVPIFAVKDEGGFVVRKGEVSES
jgi:hypothetical protein